MSLRTRLTLLFTAIVSTLLALFCILLYGVADQYRAYEFLKRLEAEAATAGHLLLGQEQMGPTLYRLLDKNHLTVLPQEEIIIYNTQDQLVYESGTDYLTLAPERLNHIRQGRRVVWQQSDRQIVGVLFTARGNSFVIVASAVDSYGVRTIQSLAQLLGIGWCVMVGLFLIAGRFFAGRTLRPISQINQQIDAITALNLSLRLPEGDQGDELSQLAQRFNRMLNRLEEAFKLQRSFVSHASHELRTPLTAITGQLEVSLLADDEPDELRATLRSVLDDVRGLNRMTNGLLDLAKASMDASVVSMGPVYLNKLLEQIQLDFQRLQPTYTIHIRLDAGDTDDTVWALRGSESLLRTAFFNLVDNGGKFSPDHTVWVQVTRQDNQFQIAIHNTGTPISADQLSAIFSPFQRGRNASGQPGHGLGLALTESIIQLHRGRIQVDSSEEAGTTFTVHLPF